MVVLFGGFCGCLIFVFTLICLFDFSGLADA